MSSTNDFLEELESNNYLLASPDQLSNYIKAVYQAGELSHKLKGSYFNVLLADYMREANDLTIVPLDTEVKLGILEEVCDTHKGIINKALDTDNMDAQERNRATAFHRTAKTTIKKAIEAGHPLDDVTIGKTALTNGTKALTTETKNLTERGMAALMTVSKIVEQMDTEQREHFELEVQRFMDNTNWSE
jgi:hypothetical protein